MLVIFIISLLSMFAVPTYKSYLLKTQRIEAKSALYALANSLENYRLKSGTYKEAPLSDKIVSAKYILKILSATHSEFTIQATLKNLKHDVECQVFTLTNAGIKRSLGSSPNQCW